MGKIEIGSRIVYAHEEGGFNALVTDIYDDWEEDAAGSVDLVFVNNDGKVETRLEVMNVHEAKNLEEGEELEPGEFIVDYWRP